MHLLQGKCKATSMRGLKAAYVWPVGTRTGSLNSLKEIGQKNVAGAPASAARTSRSLLSGPSGLMPADSLLN